MPEGFERYGLTCNPFYSERALDPLSSGADESLLVDVDGFGSIPKVDKFLQAAIDKGEAAFFMIIGKSGTGRSSFANYVLTRYCKLKDIDPKNLILPQREYSGHNKVVIFKKWFGFLRTQLNQKKLSLGPELKADFQTYLEKTDEATLEPNFQDLALRVSDLLSGSGKYGFGCCLEDVEDFKIIASAVEIFTPVPTVCVFTVKDYNDEHKEIIAPFRERCKKLAGGEIFELSQLSAAEVRKLVDRRWSSSCDRANPFDLECVEEVFGDRHRTIGLTLTLMARLIENKLANHPIGEEWPDADELGFTCEQLHGLVPSLEKTL
jgi:hypothetical protein